MATNRESAAALAERVAAIDADSLAAELQVGAMTLRDILAQLARPGRDPREDLPPPIFRRDILKLDDLTPGTELAGTVLNVVDFGAFVDIGMHVGGLVHVSHLAERFIRDPHEVIAVGDIVRVWVLAVDKPRRRVSLSMLPPGSARHHAPRTRKAAARPRRRPTAAEPRSDAQTAPTDGQPPTGGHPSRPAPQIRSIGRPRAPPSAPAGRRRATGSNGTTGGRSKRRRTPRRFLRAARARTAGQGDAPASSGDRRSTEAPGREEIALSDSLDRPAPRNPCRRSPTR